MEASILYFQQRWTNCLGMVGRRRGQRGFVDVSIGHWCGTLLLQVAVGSRSQNPALRYRTAPARSRRRVDPVSGLYLTRSVAGTVVVKWCWVTDASLMATILGFR